MIGDWISGEMLPHQNSSMTLTNMERIRALKIWTRSIQAKLEELEKDQGINQEEILRDQIMLNATQKEIQRLERKSLLNEFMIE